MLSDAIRGLVIGALAALALTQSETLRAWLGRATETETLPIGEPQESAGSRTLRLRADASGHFLVTAEVNGTAVHFLIDTGATDVVLTPEDAERLGLRLRERDYTLKYRTAGGIVSAAPVMLREIRLGPLTVRDVDAAVNSHSIGVSLLGVGFLKRLDGYAVERDSLILSW